MVNNLLWGRKCQLVKLQLVHKKTKTIIFWKQFPLFSYNNARKLITEWNVGYHGKIMG